jgi:hypothetical protein
MIPAVKTTTVNILYPHKTEEQSFLLQEFPKLGTTESVGFHLYEASVLLSQYLALELKPIKEGDGSKRKRILELGSGSCGLAGIAASWLNYDVVFTDLPIILPTLSINVERNVNKSIKHEIMPLAWGDREAIQKLMTDSPDGFDLVIGADVVYQREYIIPLLQTIFATVKREAWLCVEEREEGLVNEYLLSEAKKLGFSVKKIKMKQFPKPFCEEGRGNHLKLYKLSKPINS